MGSIDITAGLVERDKKKVQTGTVDISAGLSDAKPRKGEAMTAQERAQLQLADIRGKKISDARLQQLFKRQRELVGGGNVLTTGIVSPQTMLGAMTGVTEEQLADLESSFGMEEGASPAMAGAKRFTTGVVRDIAGLGSGATSPAGIAMAATAPFSGPVAAGVRAAAGTPFMAEGAENVLQGGSRMLEEPLNPEAVQQTLGGAGAVAGGAAAAAPAAAMLREPMRVQAQRALGVGEDVTLKAVLERNAKQAAQEAAHQQAVFETMMERGETLKAFEAKKAAQQAEFQQKTFENLLERTAVQRANEQRFLEQTTARRIKVAEQRSLMEQRAALEQELNTTAMTLRDNVRLTERNVKANLDQRYAAIREAVGDAEIAGEPVANAVRTAENMLQGSKENMKIFREILDSAGASDLAQASVFRGIGFAGRQGGMNVADLPPQVLQRMTATDPTLASRMQQAGFQIGKESGLAFRDAQGFYTELGRKMFGSERIPGDIYRALKHVHDEIGRQLQETTNRAGQGEAFRLAQADWSQYMKTFHDLRSMARGGSPVARVMRAEDPGYALDPIVGKAAGRAVEMLSPYEAFGANPGMATDLLARHVRLKNMPTKAKEIPEVVRKDTPLPKQPAPPEPLAAPRLKELPPKPEELPPVDPAALKEAILSARRQSIGNRVQNVAFVSAIFALARGNVQGALAILAAEPLAAAAVTRILRSKGLTKPTAAEVELSRP